MERDIEKDVEYWRVLKKYENILNWKIWKLKRYWKRRRVLKEYWKRRRIRPDERTMLSKNKLLMGISTTPNDEESKNDSKCWAGAKIQWLWHNNFVLNLNNCNISKFDSRVKLPKIFCAVFAVQLGCQIQDVNSGREFRNREFRTVNSGPDQIRLNYFF